MLKLRKHALFALGLAASTTVATLGVAGTSTAATRHGLQKGLKVFVIPKNLGNSIMTRVWRRKRRRAGSSGQR